MSSQEQQRQNNSIGKKLEHKKGVKNRKIAYVHIDNPHLDYERELCQETSDQYEQERGLQGQKNDMFHKANPDGYKDIPQKDCIANQEEGRLTFGTTLNNDKARGILFPGDNPRCHGLAFTCGSSHKQGLVRSLSERRHETGFASQNNQDNPLIASYSCVGYGDELLDYLKKCEKNGKTRTGYFYGDVDSHDHLYPVRIIDFVPKFKEKEEQARLQQETLLTKLHDPEFCHNEDLCNEKDDSSSFVELNQDLHKEEGLEAVDHEDSRRNYRLHGQAFVKNIPCSLEDIRNDDVYVRVSETFPKKEIYIARECDDGHGLEDACIEYYLDIMQVRSYKLIMKEKEEMRYKSCMYGIFFSRDIKERYTLSMHYQILFRSKMKEYEEKMKRFTIEMPKLRNSSYSAFFYTVSPLCILDRYGIVISSFRERNMIDSFNVCEKFSIPTRWKNISGISLYELVCQIIHNKDNIFHDSDKERNLVCNFIVTYAIFMPLSTYITLARKYGFSLRYKKISRVCSDILYGHLEDCFCFNLRIKQDLEYLKRVKSLMEKQQ